MEPRTATNRELRHAFIEVEGVRLHFAHAGCQNKRR